MRGTAIARIIIWSFVAIFLIGILAMGMIFSSDIFNMIPFSSKSSYNYKNQEMYSVGSGAVDAESITDIEINWVSGSVTVVPYSGKQIEFSEDGVYSEDEQLRYMVSNGKLIIQFRKSGLAWNFFKSSSNKNLTVKIPEKTTELLNSVDIEAVSANVDVSGIKPHDMSVSTTSGEINLENAECFEVSLETVSGRIKTSDVSANDFSLESVSGDCVLSGSFSDIDAESVSGDFEFVSSSCPGKIDCSTVSGSIKVTIPENDGFTASLDTVSGDLECDFEAVFSKKQVRYGDGSAEFDFETVSGDASIHKEITA